MTLRPSDPEKRREARRRWQKTRRDAARRYEEKLRQEVFDGERDWNSLPASNPERRTREWARAYGSKERVRWVQSLPCLVCSEKPSENAHVESGGKGRKADARLIVPLCRFHHTDPGAGYDHNKATFEARHGLDLHAEAGALERRWQDLQEAA